VREFLRELTHDPLPARPFPGDPTGGGAWSISASASGSAEPVADIGIAFGAPRRGRWDICPAASKQDLVPVRVNVRNRRPSSYVGAQISLTSTPALPFNAFRATDCVSEAFPAGVSTREAPTGLIPPEGTVVIDGFLIVDDPNTMQALESGSWTLSVSVSLSTSATYTLAQTGVGTGPRLQLGMTR
jgi:hypothetical protein